MSTCFSEVEPTERPLRIGVTIGDPAGIGPEICARFAANWKDDGKCLPILIGDRGVLEQWLDSTTAKRLAIVDEPDQALRQPDALNLIDLDEAPPSLAVGEVSAPAGSASMAYNRIGAELCLAGQLDGLVTLPVTKMSIALAGYDYPGQAEFFADLAGTDFQTLLIWRGLTVALLTTHCALSEACQLVRRSTILNSLRFLHARRQELGRDTLSIGVVALNPHAGDGGRFGHEEIEEIAPAIADAREEGIAADGPFPVNAIIAPPYDGRGYDVVLAMYHDQPVARMNMLETTTLTLGLPFIRSSVGHGSALDIAGRGIADASGLELAFAVTRTIAEARRRQAGRLMDASRAVE